MFESWRLNGLIAKLSNENPDIRRAALEKVRNMEPVPHKALPALIQLLEDSYEVIRFYSADAIERIVPPATSAVPGRSISRAAAQPPTPRTRSAHRRR